MERNRFKIVSLLLCIFLFPGVIHALSGAEQGSLIKVIGSPYITGQSPLGLAFSPTSTQLTDESGLYLANLSFAQNEIFEFQVSPVTGELTNTSESPYATFNLPVGITFSPILPNSPNVVFAASTILPGFVVYRVDLNTGLFTPLKIYEFQNAFNVAFSSIILGGAQQLFAAVSNAKTVNFYSVDLQSGEFLLLNSFDTDSGVHSLGIHSLAFSPVVTNGRGERAFYAGVVGFLPDASTRAGDVQALIFPFNIKTNEVIVPNKPSQSILISKSENGNPIAIAFASDGDKRAFAAMTSSLNNQSRIDLFTVDNNYRPLTLKTTLNEERVTFSDVAFSPLLTAKKDLDLAISAYDIKGEGNGVFVYHVDIGDRSFGMLSLIKGSPFAVGDRPLNLSYSPLITFNRQEYVYLATSNQASGTISIFSVNLVGSPTHVQVDKDKKILTWEPPKFGKKSIASYRIYDEKNTLLAEIPSKDKLKYKLRHVTKKKRLILKSVNRAGQESPPIKLAVLQDRGQAGETTCRLFDCLPFTESA